MHRRRCVRWYSSLSFSRSFSLVGRPRGHLRHSEFEPESRTTTHRAVMMRNTSTDAGPPLCTVSVVAKRLSGTTAARDRVAAAACIGTHYIHVRDRRRIAIHSRGWNRPRNVHSYHVQVRDPKSPSVVVHLSHPPRLAANNERRSYSCSCTCSRCDRAHGDADSDCVTGWYSRVCTNHPMHIIGGNHEGEEEEEED
jgi:hypothetical protein